MSPRWLNISEFFCVGYSSILKWILKCKTPPSVSPALLVVILPSWGMNVFFYFTQSSEPLHNAIIVSYTAVFSIGLRKRVRKLGKRTLFSRIPEEKLSMLSVYAKLIHTHDPVGRKCCLYRDILMQKKKKNGKKKEMTPQGKYHVYSLNISSNK